MSVKKWMVYTAAISVGLLAMAAVASWGINQRQAMREMDIFLANKYQRAFYDMTDQVQNLEVMLSKSLVSADPRLDTLLLMDIRQQAAFAQSNLGQLPLTDALAGRTTKFLSQVGDFADSLARQVSRGGAVQAQQWETLNSLYQQSSELNRELQGIQNNFALNNFNFSEMVRQTRKNLQNPPDDLTHTEFQAVDQLMRRYPALIYDGPFSEHLEAREPAGLQGLAIIDPEQARQEALKFVAGDDQNGRPAEVAGNVEGQIPAFRVEVPPEQDGGGRTLLDVTRQGGRVVWMFNDRPVGDPAISMEQAQQKALEFLESRGYNAMLPTFYLRHGNAATFNLAAEQDGVILYPDIIKVTVALDNGEVLGVESTGYLMSHRRRELPAVKLSEEQARAVVTPHLEVASGRLALIPVGPEDERMTYEFRGSLGEETYLVYINALDGREENVIKLIETPDGTLTM